MYTKYELDGTKYIITGTDSRNPIDDFYNNILKTTTTIFRITKEFNIDQLVSDFFNKNPIHTLIQQNNDKNNEIITNNENLSHEPEDTKQIEDAEIIESNDNINSSTFDELYNNVNYDSEQHILPQLKKGRKKY